MHPRLVLGGGKGVLFREVYSRGKAYGIFLCMAFTSCCQSLTVVSIVASSINICMWLLQACMFFHWQCAYNIVCIHVLYVPMYVQVQQCVACTFHFSENSDACFTDLCLVNWWQMVWIVWYSRDLLCRSTSSSSWQPSSTELCSTWYTTPRRSKVRAPRAILSLELYIFPGKNCYVRNNIIIQFTFLHMVCVYYM